MSSILVRGQHAEYKLTTLLTASLLEHYTADTTPQGHQLSPSTGHCSA